MLIMFSMSVFILTSLNILDGALLLKNAKDEKLHPLLSFVFLVLFHVAHVILRKDAV